MDYLTNQREWLENILTADDKGRGRLFEEEKPLPKFEYLLPFANYVAWAVETATEPLRENFLPGALVNPLREYCTHMTEILWQILPKKLMTVEQPVDWRALMAQYPAALRLCHQWTEDFIAFSVHTINALVQKLPEMASIGLTPQHGKVKAFLSTNAGLVNGKFVWIIEFENGEKIVSKPRSGEDLRLLQTFCNSLTAKADFPQLSFPAYLAYENGSFVSFIAPQPVTAADDFHLYFQRCGFLSCALIFLNGKDFHFENIIAVGSQPVAIDTELAISEFDDREALPDILDNGMFPKINMVGVFYLGGNFLLNEIPDSPCLPYDETGSRTCAAYWQDFEKGFTTAYQTVIRCREEILADSSLRRVFGCSLRYLTRNLSFYAKYLSLAFQPQHLVSEAVFSQRLEKLDKFYTLIPQPPKLEKIAREVERQALIKGYEPRIAIDYPESGENDLYTAFCRRIRWAADEHQQRQIAIIHSLLIPRNNRDSLSSPLNTEAPENPREIIYRAVDSYLEQTLLRMKARQNLVLMAPFANGNYYLAAEEYSHSEMLLGLGPVAYLRKDRNQSAAELYAILKDNAESAYAILSEKLNFDGIIHGTAGTLFLCELMLQLGADEPFGRIKTAILEKQASAQRRHLIFPKLNMEDGACGSLMALGFLPPEEKTASVREQILYYAEQIAENLNDKALQAPGFAAGKLGFHLAIQSVWQDLTPELREKTAELYEETIPVAAELTHCHCLAIGNALNLQLRLKRGESVSEDAAKVAKSMLDRMEQGESPLGEPEDFPFPGFFYGGGGLLYTLLQATEPALISIL